MGLPDEAFEIRGGCNCRAIRYRIQVPAVSERPINSYGGPSQEHSTAGSSSSSPSPMRFPMVAIDHCNDCRQAVAHTTPIWLCCPAEYIQVSLLKDRSSSSDSTVAEAPNFVSDAAPGDKCRVAMPEDDDETQRGPWRPAFDVLRPGTAESKAAPWVRFYESSGARFRSFCGRCGTNLTYMIYPMPEGWPEIFDMLVGAFDRKYIEKDWMMPERHLWWDKGIPWMHEVMTGKAQELPRHPLSSMKDLVTS